ncbi:DUF3599 family protein [Clostridium sp. BJN0013]|uniref:DUF3599 family protein n=1 Tax=Clostridium sp. BJN0013 TaxID=3236840 RepID=UPI0034C5CE1C
MSLMGMFNRSFTVSRTSTDTNPVTHIVEPKAQTLGPYVCKIGRANGNVIQSSPQAVFTQSLRLYTLINADIKTGDVVTVGNTKYIVNNVYPCNGHHIEADITFKQEV